MSHLLLEGSALNVLKSIESNTIQTCITSPPYYGLRSYGTTPQVWDADDSCNHEWQIVIKQNPNGTGGKRTGQKNIGVNTFNASHVGGILMSESCINCGAMKCELGLEPTLKDYIRHLSQIFAEVFRVLKPDGTLWLNIGDNYSGSNNGSHDAKADLRINKGQKCGSSSVRRKSLMNVPARLAIELTDNVGFIERNCIIWHKINGKPENVKDRFTNDFEYLYFFSKNEHYKFHQQLEPYTKPMNRWGGKALKATGESKWDEGTGQSTYRDRDMRPNEKGRNMRAVWSLIYEPSRTDHWASYPTKLVEVPVLSCTDENDLVLDPFNGSATTGVVALKNHRKYVGIELLPEYITISKERLKQYEELHTSAAV